MGTGFTSHTRGHIMAKNDETNLDTKISELQEQLTALMRERKLKEILTDCQALNIGQLESVSSFIKSGARLGAAVVVKKPTMPVKAPATTEEKTFSLVDGKVFFGEQEITETKLDKNGKRRIKRAGKGMPAEVDKIENEEIRNLVLAMPIVEE